MNNFDLNNRVAVVTGGSQGFGFASDESTFTTGNTFSVDGGMTI